MRNRRERLVISSYNTQTKLDSRNPASSNFSTTHAHTHLVQQGIGSISTMIRMSHEFLVRQVRITRRVTDFFHAGVNINACIDFPRVCIIGYATFRRNTRVITRAIGRSRCFFIMLSVSRGNYVNGQRFGFCASAFTARILESRYFESRQCYALSFPPPRYYHCEINATQR